MQDIFLCTISEIDLDNQRQIDFSSLDSQYKWFDKQNVKVVKGNVAVDTLTPSIDLNINLGAIKNYDYLWLLDENNKRIFYFITGKKKKNAKTTVILKCDVFQTYMFNYKIYDSFVERCHTKRWQSYNVPTMEIIDEGFPVGEYKYYSSEKIAKLNESYLVSSTTPLGTLSGNSLSSGEMDKNTEVSSSATAKYITGSRVKGAKAISKEGLRFVKGYEGFAQYGAKFSGESFNTAGYGTTEKWNPTYYNRLKPFPCSEWLATQALYSIIKAEYTDVLINKLVANGVDKNDIRQCELDAMCSISMNMGVYGFMKTSLFTQIVKYYKSVLGAYTLKDKWYSTAITSSDTGQVLQGLKNRRIAEFNVFAEGRYEMRSITVFDENGKSVGILQNNNGDGYLPNI